MNLSGIRPQVGFYDNNSIRVKPEFNPIPAEQTSDNNQQRQAQGFGDGPAATVEISREGMATVKKNVEKAVSDMEKDTAIHRYQYFVKDKQVSEDSTIRTTEDFTL